MSDVLVVIPTYNERVSLPKVVRRLRESLPEAHVLVVDDDSPDGTGELADGLAAEDPAVHVLHREGKQGLGTAYVAGFGWGLERGYGVLVEMDADGSHQPEELPALIEGLRADDEVALAIGSRWVPGGAVVNWPRRRQLLSRFGNAYVRLVLGLGVRDATAGFRAYRADVLAGMDLASVASQGYCFQVDMAWRVSRRGHRVVEVPITFVERAEGESKMSRDIVLEALGRVTSWGVRRRVEQIRRGVRGIRGGGPRG